MPSDKRLCHGQFGSLVNSSGAYRFSTLRKLLWSIENKGLSWTLELILFKVMSPIRTKKKGNPDYLEKIKQSPCDEVLNLKPGELVEVKSEREIFTTLDADGKNRGLLWMRGMKDYCGKTYRVLRRVETILLESNGKLRKMRNTVLLEGVTCDGSEFYGCDRSCFHYWREVWLRRVVE